MAQLPNTFSLKVFLFMYYHHLGFPPLISDLSCYDLISDFLYTLTSKYTKLNLIFNNLKNFNGKTVAEISVLTAN